MPSPVSTVSHPEKADLDALVDALAKADIDFVIVGGAAAVLHGSPTTTLDLDIVHSRTPDNVARLMEVLKRLDAKIRNPAGRTLRPTPELLQQGDQVRLTTTLGPLDPMGTLHDGRGYKELLEVSEWVTDGDLSLRVRDLRTLIEVKREAGRSKDRLVLPVLMALLRRLEEE